MGREGGGGEGRGEGDHVGGRWRDYVFPVGESGEREGC